MRDHSGRCCERAKPAGELAGSWIRDHVCRLEAEHHGAHECTCMWQWETASEEKVSA